VDIDYLDGPDRRVHVEGKLKQGEEENLKVFVIRRGQIKSQWGLKYIGHTCFEERKGKNLSRGGGGGGIPWVRGRGGRGTKGKN